MADLGEWPAEELETLGACPICHSAARSVRFPDLTDMAFGVAPGIWTMWDCGGCGCAYLDPRPTPASIGRAYARYYTHGLGAFRLDPPGPLGWRDRLVTGMRNAWLNREYGASLPWALPFGAALAPLFPERLRRLAYMLRHLPPLRGGRARLLDAGCGGGDFLRIARQLGYDAVGLDFDGEAVARGKADGLDIHQGAMPGTGFGPGSFDHITVAHVLEHLHDPVGTLVEFLSILKPGGRLWISQPNLGALGLVEFGRAWRGLEPPRHLSLFGCQGLVDLLVRLGYERVELVPAVPQADFYYRQSLSQREGVDPNQPGDPPGWNGEWAQRAASADAAAALDATLSENLTITAWKPA